MDTFVKFHPNVLPAPWSSCKHHHHQELWLRPFLSDSQKLVFRLLIYKAVKSLLEKANCNPVTSCKHNEKIQIRLISESTNRNRGVKLNSKPEGVSYKSNPENRKMTTLQVSAVSPCCEAKVESSYTYKPTNKQVRRPLESATAQHKISRGGHQEHREVRVADAARYHYVSSE